MRVLAFTFILFLFSLLTAFGQVGSSISLLTEEPTRFVESQNDFYINSNAITNSFINSFYFGKHIESAQINDIAEKLKGTNRLGGVTSVGIGYYDSRSKFTKTQGVSYFVELNYKEYFHTEFSSDLFKIGFQGNSSFNGMQADLGNFYYQQLIYQQLKIGILNKISDDLLLGIGISVINGQKNMQMATNNAYLFTAEDGEYIDLNADYNFKQTDTLTHINLFANNGLGASGDLYISYKSEKSSFNFNLVDLGLINWSGTSSNYRIDTLVRFEAYNVSNIFDLQDTVSLNYAPDKITDDLTKDDNKKYSSYIPALINFMYERKLGGMDIRVGGNYFFNARHFPQAYLQLNKALTKSITVGGILSYGGYGFLDAGIEINYKIGNSFHIKAGSRHVDGLLFPTKTSGEGAYVQLRKIF
ncbi:MAG: hypothetical protein COC01_04135 [Bacteroidetes bacterium]|nr:MAG: hypothetical protein COC01_04135 [Bacteroidota bacterium]